MRSQAERAFVWAGGTVFVASLIATAWLYTFHFGAAEPFHGWRPVAVDAVLLSIFASHHSVFARDAVKTRLARVIPGHLLRSVYVWVASLLLIAVCASWRRVGGELYRTSSVVYLCAVAADLVGVWLIAQSVRALSALELAGIRTAVRDEPLTYGGVYGFVRHPLYLGWMLIVFVTPHLTGDRLAFAVLTTAYLWIAIPWEERALERSHGNAYRQYKNRVRWRVVPGVY
jgi:protein-S-isoprenylcysteine O-methyltransferase Ste14